MASQRRRLAQKGVSLLVGTASMALLIPSGGLAIDAALLYYTKARLQGAVDGAALAAARSLSLGANPTAQTVSAKQDAVNWFYTNFPATAWGTSNTQMDQSMVSVFDDATNPSLRNVQVQANTTVPTIFMRWFNVSTTLVAALGNASRRDTVIMMVLDRSSSMVSAGACQDLKDAAKVFTGGFAAGRDRIGMVSFSDGVRVHPTDFPSAGGTQPTSNFRTKLGYDDDITVGNGEIDNIDCLGGTNTSSAISLAYNELYKTNLPGAFNVLLVETDGLPNSATLNWWDSVNTKTGLQGGGCKDTANKAPNASGWLGAGVQRAWTPGYNMNNGGTGFMANIPAGPVGSLYSTDPNSGNTFLALGNPWHPNANYGMTTNYVDNGNIPGCGFNGAPSDTAAHRSVGDFNWLPMTDVYGNEMKPAVDLYLPVNTYSAAGFTRVKFSTDSDPWQNYHNATSNLAISAAYRARTNATLPVTVFVLGLGGAPGYVPDYTLLQRIANDPNGDEFSGGDLYDPCATQPNCVNYANQPQGKFIWSINKTQLRKAFTSLQSQILRLSK